MKTRYICILLAIHCKQINVLHESAYAIQVYYGSKYVLFNLNSVVLLYGGIYYINILKHMHHFFTIILVFLLFNILCFIKIIKINKNVSLS